MIQYNVSENAAKQINETDYSQQQPRLDANGNETGKQGVNAGRVAAGIRHGSARMPFSSIMNASQR